MSEHQQVNRRKEKELIVTPSLMEILSKLVLVDCDDVSVFHCGGRAGVEKPGLENYPWIEPRRSEIIYCTI